MPCFAAERKQPERRTTPRRAPGPAVQRRANRPGGGSPEPLLMLALARLQRDEGAAPGPAVHPAGDRWEREADRTTGEVMRMPAPGAACACGGTCPRCRAGHGAAHLSGGGSSLPEAVHEVVRSPGRPLDAAAREFMEPRFGSDFGAVRVHDDARAAESARAVDARAYTVGEHVVFDHGRYRPETGAGRELLAHELAHVVQQRQGAATGVQRWSYGSGSHATRGGNTFRELTKEEREGPNGMDAAMKIVDRLVTGADWRAKHCQKWYVDNCKIPATLADIHNRAVIWVWRAADGAAGWGLSDGGNTVHHAATEKSFNMKSRWFLASVIIHEYWHDCSTFPGDADIGNEAEKACGLPGHAF